MKIILDQSFENTVVIPSQDEHVQSRFDLAVQEILNQQKEFLQAKIRLKEMAVINSVRYEVSDN